MASVRVAIVGAGNCAASLVQGVHYYRDADASQTVPGLMHVMFGDYHVSDVEFVAAFDVDDKKVGKDLSEAINASENNTITIADVPTTGITVQRGHTLDGLGKYYRQTIDESGAEPVDVVAALRDAKVDVLVSYLPVGSENADKFYAQCAIDAGVAQDLHHVDRLGLALLDRLEVVPAQSVERRAALHGDAERWHVGDLDGVVLAGVRRL